MLSARVAKREPPGDTEEELRVVERRSGRVGRVTGRVTTLDGRRLPLSMTRAGLLKIIFLGCFCLWRIFNC